MYLVSRSWSGCSVYLSNLTESFLLTMSFDTTVFLSDQQWRYWVIEYLVSQYISLQGMITACSTVVEWRLAWKQCRKLAYILIHKVHSPFLHLCCIYNKLLLSLLVIHYKKNRRNIGSKTCRDATLDSIPWICNFYKSSNWKGRFLTSFKARVQV